MEWKEFLVTHERIKFATDKAVVLTFPEVSVWFPKSLTEFHAFKYYKIRIPPKFSFRSADTGHDVSRSRIVRLLNEKGDVFGKHVPNRLEVPVHVDIPDSLTHG